MPFNSSFPAKFFSPLLLRRMLIGGTIGLLLISFFLFTAGKADAN